MSRTTLEAPDGITIYGPETGLRISSAGALRAVWQQICAYRWHIWVTFVRRFRARARGAALGTAWAYILPLVPITVFVLLKSLRVFPQDPVIDPTVYVTLGVTIWLLISGMISAPMTAFGRERSLLARSRFPLAGAALVGCADVLFDTGVRLVASTFVVLWFVGVPPLTALALPLLLLPAAALGFGIGILLAVGNTIADDVRNLTDIVLRYLIFVSFAIFPLPPSLFGAWFYWLNPAAILVDNLRSVVVLGTFATPIAFAVVCGIAALVFTIACRVLYVTQNRIRGSL